MNRTLNFTKRNFLEMLRDPIIYIFCAVFPVAMLIMFSVINRYSGGNTPVFELPSLIPGIMLFSFSFVMLLMSLLVSKDKSTAFLVRLYSSPMKTSEFLIGYALPGITVGIVQEIICLVSGKVLALLTGGAYFGIGASILLCLAMLPMLLTNVALGIWFGTVLSDKSAPGLSSVLITASGLLGGAWMPLDTMGGLETFCRFLPFYPSVYIGRILTGANHTIPDLTSGLPVPYSWDTTAALGWIPILLCLVLSVTLAAVSFYRMMHSDKK